jgi:hypothetical protein
MIRASSEVVVELLQDVLAGALVGLLLGGAVARLRTRAVGGHGAVECGLRVLQGDAPGLTTRWRHGVASLSEGELVWRRWPVATTRARLRVATIGRTSNRTPRLPESLLLLPGAVVLPVVLDSGARLELAVDELDLDDLIVEAEWLSTE